MDMLKQRHLNKGLARGYETNQTTIRGKTMRIVNKKSSKSAISIDGENILYFENFAKYEI